MDIGTKLKAARIAAGLTQEQAAELLGVSRQTMSNWENNNIQPSVDMLVSIARLFSVSTDYLLCLDDRQVLDVSGLSPEYVAHIQQVVDDMRR